MAILLDIIGSLHQNEDHTVIMPYKPAKALFQFLFPLPFRSYSYIESGLQFKYPLSNLTGVLVSATLNVGREFRFAPICQYACLTVTHYLGRFKVVEASVPIHIRGLVLPCHPVLELCGYGRVVRMPRSPGEISLR